MKVRIFVWYLLRGYFLDCHFASLNWLHISLAFILDSLPLYIAHIFGSWLNGILWAPRSPFYIGRERSITMFDDHPKIYVLSLIQLCIRSSIKLRYLFWDGGTISCLVLVFLVGETVKEGARPVGDGCGDHFVSRPLTFCRSTIYWNKQTINAGLLAHPETNLQRLRHAHACMLSLHAWHGGRFSGSGALSLLYVLRFQLCSQSHKNERNRACKCSMRVSIQETGRCKTNAY